MILPRTSTALLSMPMPTQIALSCTIELHKICIGSDAALREHRVVGTGSCITLNKRCACPYSRLISPSTHFESSSAAVCRNTLPRNSWHGQVRGNAKALLCSRGNEVMRTHVLQVIVHRVSFYQLDRRRLATYYEMAYGKQFQCDWLKRKGWPRSVFTEELGFGLGQHLRTTAIIRISTPSICT